MKILHLTYHSDGGVAISIRRLNKLLREKNIKSNVLYLENLKNIKGISINLFIITKWKLILFLKKIILKILTKRSTKDTVSFNLFEIIKLNRIIKKNKIDIIHLHWIGNEIISLKEISNIICPVVWTLHDMWPFCGIEHYAYQKRHLKNYSNQSRDHNESGFDFDKIFWKLKIKFFSKKKFNLIAPSKWMAYNLKKSQVFKKSKTTILPPMIDLNKWSNFSIKKTINRKKKILLFSGTSSVNYRKGFNYLSDAINKYLPEDEYVLIVIGDKPKEFENTKIEKKYLGYIEKESDLIKIYRMADIFVLPSLAESFGQVFLEAAAVGMPSVAFSNTAASEVITHKKNGYLAKYLSSKDIAKGILWSKNNLLSKKIKIRIKKNIKEKFSSQNRLKEYINLYKNIYRNVD